MNGEQQKKQFIETLEAKEIKYTDVSDDQNQAVNIRFGLDNIKDMEIVIMFDADGGSVHLVTNSVGNFNQEKKSAVLLACNECNREYRWVKYYIDMDNNVMATDDGIIYEGTTGEECYALVIRMANVVDRSYPVFMKAMWG